MNGNTYAMQRFAAPLGELKALLEKGRYQKDKALGFYRHKGRSILFQLEALCRLYRGFQDKTLFKEWYRKFKVLEDALGNMDYNESMYFEFSAYPELKKACENNFGAHFSESSAYVSNMLKNDGWLSGECVSTFIDELNKQNWKDEEDDRTEYGLGMIREMKQLTSKYEDGELNPFEIEEGLHEFRRRLRWISIYAQASYGMVQLNSSEYIPQNVQHYCTPEVLTLPYNTLLPPQKNQRTLNIQSHYFYALSWLIQHLGELKDIGLRTAAFHELCKESGVNSKAVYKRFASQCQYAPETICNRAEEAIDTFLTEDFITKRIARDLKRCMP